MAFQRSALKLRDEAGIAVLLRFHFCKSDGGKETLHQSAFNLLTVCKKRAPLNPVAGNVRHSPRIGFGLRF